MTLERFVDRIEKHVVGDRSHRLTSFVKVRQDARARLFDQITNNLVVEIVNLQDSGTRNDVEPIEQSKWLRLCVHVAM